LFDGGGGFGDLGLEGLDGFITIGLVGGVSFIGVGLLAFNVVDDLVDEDDDVV